MIMTVAEVRLPEQGPQVELVVAERPSPPRRCKLM
jgi:hypothetical protein